VDRIGQGRSSLRAWLGAVLALAMVLVTGTVYGQATPSLAAARPAPAARATVLFVIRGLRNDNGVVMGALFDRPEAWAHEGQESAECRSAIRGGVARCSMQVPPGRYAFAFAHDEDRDGEFDRDFLGIPQEGYGFSNDVRPRMSLPSFQSAAFTVGAEAPSGQVVVTTRYGI
jgi:uncharacterized protein (DUF2141 family)